MMWSFQYFHHIFLSIVIFFLSLTLSINGNVFIFQSQLLLLFFQLIFIGGRSAFDQCNQSLISIYVHCSSSHISSMVFWSIRAFNQCYSANNTSGLFINGNRSNSEQNDVAKKKGTLCSRLIGSGRAGYATGNNVVTRI